MKFNFKKVSAIATSVLLTGMTMGVAAAAAFPAPYSSSSASGVAIVSGSGTGVDDTVAEGTVSSYLATKVKSSAGAPSGDSVQLDKSTDRLNVGENITDSYGTSVDNDDLTVLLADGTFTADDSDTFDYEQSLKIGADLQVTHFRDSDYEDLAGLDEKTPTVGIKVTSGQQVLNYSLDFTTEAESDIASSEMEDIEGSTIPLLGKSYYVSDMDNGTSDHWIGKTTLLDAANTGIVSEGETSTITVGGKTYEVEVSSLTTTQVRLVINGQTTNELAEGASQKLSDGSYVGVKDIFQRDVAGVVGNVEFSIGSGKLEITSGSNIVLNDDTINGVVGYIDRGTASSGAEKIDNINIVWTAKKDEFIAQGTDLVMPGFGGVKFTMGEIIRPEEEVITIQPDGDDSIEMTIPVEDGDAKFNILYANATGDLNGIGKAADERLATSGNSTLVYQRKKNNDDYHQYFVVTYNTTKDAETYKLSALISESNNRNETTIKNELTGVECKDRKDGDTCKFGSAEFTINRAVYNSTDEWIEIAAGTGVNFHTAFTKGGLMVYLPWGDDAIQSNLGAMVINNSADPWDVLGAEVLNNTAGQGFNDYRIYFDGEDKDDTIAAGDAFNVTIDDTTDNKLQVKNVVDSGTGGANGLEQGNSKTYETYMYIGEDDVTPKVMHYTNPDEDWAEIYYPAGSDGDSQSYVEVFLTEESSSTGTAGSMVFKDNEQSSWSSRDVVLVGGSCINSATATALGTGKVCEAAWTTATGVGEGEYLIKTVANKFSDGKIALVVAGYAKADTAAAATKLTTDPAEIDTTDGKEYRGKTGVTGSLAFQEVTA
jgi:hypothetical protein